MFMCKANKCRVKYEIWNKHINLDSDHENYLCLNPISYKKYKNLITTPILYKDTGNILHLALTGISRTQYIKFDENS